MGIIGGTDPGKRLGEILGHLARHRAATDEEAGRLRTELENLTRRETLLREEITALDTILLALPHPPKESEAPSLFVSAPKPAQAEPPAAPPRRRRRKGTRREEMLPRLREKVGTRTFTTKDVTDALLEAELGERRKAYFAAWSLVRDLVEDSVVAVVAEEGSGPRKKRTYRFADQFPTALEGAPSPP